MTPNPNWQVTKPLILHSSWPSASLFFINWQLVFYCFWRLTVNSSISAQRMISRSSWKLRKVPGQTYRKTTQNHKTQALNRPQTVALNVNCRDYRQFKPKNHFYQALRWVWGDSYARYIFTNLMKNILST